MKRYMMMASASMMVLALTACDPVAQPSSTQMERRATEQMAQQAAVAIGVPAIKNFTEKRLLKTILELRDQPNVVTYTYTTDLNGKLHKVCPTTSIGYPIPYSTQYTNPQQTVRDSRGADGLALVTIPQADPNALFSPSSADASWVMCVHPETKELAVTYIEDRIRTYLFPMPSID